jgi:hypothetical protein
LELIDSDGEENGTSDEDGSEDGSEDEEGTSDEENIS